MPVPQQPGRSYQPDSFETWISQNALGNVLNLGSAPTAAIPQLEEQQFGYFNNKMYFVIGGVLKEFAVSNTA